ncbi:MAG TPA: amidohydrolase family protein, partial [Ilumatobacteraceae bacterium]
GSAGFVADVRVRDGLIVEIGADLQPQGEPVLDATGAVVAPGFIENHTHVDPQLFWDPLCDPTPQHGVTTVLAGNCSLSLFPVNEAMRNDAVGLFSLIEDIPREAFEHCVPSWTNYAGYRDSLAAGGLGVNIATMVGHTFLRWYVMGDAAWERTATPAEIEQMCTVLAADLDAGAFGISTSFADKDHHGRWVPSCLADDVELEALFDVLARQGGIVEFIPNLSDGKAEEHIERIATLTGPRGVISTWNTLAQTKRAPDRAGRFLTQATRLQAAGVRIFPQATPRPFDLRIGWDRSVMFNDMATTWALVIRADADGKRAMLADPAWRAVAQREWDAAKLSILPTWDISRLRLITVTRPENERWVGKTLADLVADRGGHPSDVLADWVLDNDLDPGVVASGVSNDDAEQVGEILRHPATVIGASDNGAHVAMFCAAGDSTLYLTRYVRDRGEIGLEAAIHELTGRQAAALGFGGRGTIAVGSAGDLVVFALDELHWQQDSMVADLPGGGSRLRRPEGGYRHTIVAGEVVQSGGVLTGARPGRPIGFTPTTSADEGIRT